MVLQVVTVMGAFDGFFLTLYLGAALVMVVAINSQIVWVHPQSLRTRQYTLVKVPAPPCNLTCIPPSTPQSFYFIVSVSVCLSLSCSLTHHSYLPWFFPQAAQRRSAGGEDETTTIDQIELLEKIAEKLESFKSVQEDGISVFGVVLEPKHLTQLAVLLGSAVATVLGDLITSIQGAEGGGN